MEKLYEAVCKVVVPEKAFYQCYAEDEEEAEKMIRGYMEEDEYKVKKATGTDIQIDLLEVKEVE